MGLQFGEPGINPWVGKIPCRREVLSTPGFWPGEFHGLTVHGVTKSGAERLSLSLHFLMGGAMLSKSLIQFSVDGWGCVPSLLFSWGQTLPSKVHLVKAMVFPVVMYGCESWTVKKAER